MMTQYTLPKNANYEQMYGDLNKYPAGVVNPASTGMKLWTIRENHNFNEYKYSPFCGIKSSIVVKNGDAYVCIQPSFKQ